MSTTVGTSQNTPIYTPPTNTNAAGTASASAGTDNLTQSDFLNLLVAQLQYQDPTDPESDTDMASQMAQFSSLTAVNNLSSSMSSFAQFTQMSTGASLIGATVTTSATDSNNNPISGQVSAVSTSNGTVNVVVNGNNVPLSDVTGIAPTSSTNATNSSSSGS